ncbi:MAG: CNP1-like family protein [Polaromonas sp.]|nr:CNP1-like family protein [Polaromonas sp.]
MNFKPALMALLLGASCAAWAQPTVDNPDWKESEVPPPPAFDISKLIMFDVSPNSSLVYGVDPSTIRISNSDSVVRYVVVARSASGASNAMYEGIRCSTGEFKTYARYSPDGHWNPIAHPQWHSLFEKMPSKHALRFAKAGACDNAAPASSVDVLVNRLKNPSFGTKN